MDQSYNAHPAQVELAKVFSSVTLLGPPMGEKLVKLIAHLFTPEEAEVAIHLPIYYPRSVDNTARKARRVPDLIRPLLAQMREKKVIMGDENGYAILPLIPGMFEYMLMDGRDSEWHRKYAELICDLFSTGYVKQYNTMKFPVVRSIPVQSAIQHKSIVTRPDLIDEMIAAHSELAVANVCQCRQSMHFQHKECKRSAPSDGCLIFGAFAKASVAGNNARSVSREEMKDIVADRWAKNLVFFTGNVSPDSPNAICTCCDCCCHALETINHFNGHVLITPPHFIAKVDESLCNDCGKCARVCNTYAHTMSEKKHYFAEAKCIGCSVCVGNCKQKAIEMVENPNYKEPSKSFPMLGLKMAPVTAMNAIKVKFTR